jgi:hypothetical protein
MSTKTSCQMDKIRARDLSQCYIRSMQMLGMKRLATYQHRKKATTALMLIFIVSQLLSCCLVNEKIVQFFASTFTTAHEMQVSAIPGHSCCPKPIEDDAGESKPNGGHPVGNDQASKHKGCTIQDANQRLPLMPSESAYIPEMPDLVLSILTNENFQLPRFPIRPNLLTSSDPPVYLAQKRLLI